MPLAEKDAIDESLDVPMNVPQRDAKTERYDHADEGAPSLWVVLASQTPAAHSARTNLADHNRRNDREDGGTVQEEADVDQTAAQSPHTSAQPVR